MNERGLAAKFRGAVLAKFPRAWYYKIPDTAGLGGMRPFDAIAIINGKTFCIEFKRGNISKVSAYQAYNLRVARQNGAYTIVANEMTYTQNLKAMEAIAYGRSETEGERRQPDDACVGPLRDPRRDNRR